MVWMHNLVKAILTKYGRAARVALMCSIAAMLGIWLAGMLLDKDLTIAITPFVTIVGMVAGIYITLSVYAGGLLLAMRFFRWLNKKYPFIPFPE